MRILHLLQSNRFSGAENVIFQIIGMFRDNADVEMIYCSRDGQIREALDEHNISFAPIDELNVSEVKRVIREQKPDVIHAHDMRASLIAALSCGRIPLVSHIHNNNFDSRGLSAKSVAYLLAAIKAKHIFWVSESSYDGYAFSKPFKKKSEILYNIIDIDALYQKMNTDTNTYNYDVIYVGRLTYQKNPQRLMQVFKRVVEKNPQVKIGVVGTGDLENETKTLCSQLGLQNNIEFLGFQSNPLKMLHDARVMVMTSRWEGTPMCALEAMVLGVPIVSTPTDGLCDLITDGENGYLSDDDDALAEKILKLVSDNRLSTEMSQKTKKIAFKINEKEPYREKILKAYEECQNV